jgi:hypothetical protein
MAPQAPREIGGAVASLMDNTLIMNGALNRKKEEKYDPKPDEFTCD